MLETPFHRSDGTGDGEGIRGGGTGFPESLALLDLFLLQVPDFSLARHLK